MVLFEFNVLLKLYVSSYPESYAEKPGQTQTFTDWSNSQQASTMCKAQCLVLELTEMFLVQIGKE